MKAMMIALAAATIFAASAAPVDISWKGRNMGYFKIQKDGSLLITGKPEDKNNRWLSYGFPMNLPNPGGKLIRISGEARTNVKKGYVSVSIRQIGADKKTLPKGYLGATLKGKSDWKPFDKVIKCYKATQKVEFYIIGLSLSKDSTVELRNIQWEYIPGL